ncbi:hypothetical protein L596_003905 [Steinernema carpocapsae]|uniref:Uncharacterized protein n=1 Tax=Steinernema carpocapsae TaxID=34508 RepID=A0A4U8UXE7_STECR|nr:hypothetical protein L596_003905 [Steinernema carpocapsae]
MEMPSCTAYNLLSQQALVSIDVGRRAADSDGPAVKLQGNGGHRLITRISGSLRSAAFVCPGDATNLRWCSVSYKY